MQKEKKMIVKKLLWDYNFTEEEFLEILEGKKEFGNFNRNWAVRRCIEGLNYYDLIQIIDLKMLLEVWPEIRDKIRIKNIKDGMDYVLRKYIISTAR